jgi:hypothetical protein
MKGMVLNPPCRFAFVAADEPALFFSPLPSSAAIALPLPAAPSEEKQQLSKPPQGAQWKSYQLATVKQALEVPAPTLAIPVRNGDGDALYARF